MNSLGKRYSRPQIKIVIRPLLKFFHLCFIRLPHAASAFISRLPLSTLSHNNSFSLTTGWPNNIVRRIVIKMSNFRICGPKMAIFGTCLSIWGVIQLSFMAMAFYQNSVAFVEDLPESVYVNNPLFDCTNTTTPGHKCDFNETVSIMKTAYVQQAKNCGMAVALYIVTLLVSLHQLWMNSEKDTVIRVTANPRGRNAYPSEINSKNKENRVFVSQDNNSWQNSFKGNTTDSEMNEIQMYRIKRGL